MNFHQGPRLGELTAWSSLVSCWQASPPTHALHPSSWLLRLPANEDIPVRSWKVTDPPRSRDDGAHSEILTFLLFGCGGGNNPTLILVVLVFSLWKVSTTFCHTLLFSSWPSFFFSISLSRRDRRAFSVNLEWERPRSRSDFYTLVFISAVTPKRGLAWIL